MSSLTFEDEECILRRPILHIRNAGNEKRYIMRQLWNSFNFWIKCPLDKQKILTKLGDALCDVALIADDMEDNAILRRGIPTAHLIYGLPLTTYAVIYESLNILNKFLKHAKNQSVFFDYFIQLGIELFTGQGLDIYFRDKVICPTMEEYKDIVRGKVLGVLRFGNRVLQIFNDKPRKEFSLDLLQDVCLFAQIYNDYINLHNAKYSSVRVFCDDLDEGKFGFPMIHAIQMYPDDRRALDMIRERPKEIEKKKYFVDLLEEFGSFEYTRKTLEKLIEDAHKEIERLKLEKNPRLTKFFEHIYDNIETEIYCDGCD